jgi:hypothetical protein
MNMKNWRASTIAWQSAHSVHYRCLIIAAYVTVAAALVVAAVATQDLPAKSPFMFR